MTSDISSKPEKFPTIDETGSFTISMASLTRKYDALPGHPTMAFNFRDFAHDYVESLVETLSEMPLAPIEEFWKLVEAAREKTRQSISSVTVVVLAPLLTVQEIGPRN